MNASHWDGDFPHPTLNQSASGSGGVGASNQELFSQRGAYLAPAVVGALDTQCGGGKLTQQSVANGHLIGTITARMFNALGARDVEEGAILAVTHSLRGEGFDASEDGTGRGTPLVPVMRETGHGVWVEDTIAGTLDASMGASGHSSRPAVIGQPIAFDTTQITSPSNYSRPQPGDPCHPLAAGAHPPAVAFGWPPEVADPLSASEGKTYTHEGRGNFRTHNVVEAAMAVRRLTPRECERLQGFPDDYTLIPWRGKPADQCPDGPRYKALGNSMAVPCMRWIGERIKGATQ